MKKTIVIILFLSLIFMVAGCKTEEKPLTKKDLTINNKVSETNVFYFGEGEEWFATYTVSKVRTSYFDSLYIQYITDRTVSVEEQTSKKIGDIEYLLNAGKITIESSFPQHLKGIGNFHTASEVNASIVDNVFPEEITLEIRWQDKKENIVLKKLD